MLTISCTDQINMQIDMKRETDLHSIVAAGMQQPNLQLQFGRFYIQISM